MSLAERLGLSHRRDARMRALRKSTICNDFFVAMCSLTAERFCLQAKLMGMGERGVRWRR